MKSKLFLLLLLPLTLFAADEIVVRLPTQAAQIPVYVLEWEGERSKAQELRQTLLFDIDHNGRTSLAEESAQRKAQGARDCAARSFNASAWAQLGVPYVLQGSLKESTLLLRLFSTRTGDAVISLSLMLSGEADSDQRKIHQASDALFKSLFGDEGIATSRILYTVLEGDRSEVFIADYNGKFAKRLANDGGYCVTPTFFPPEKGKRCGSYLYTAYRHGQPKIYLSPLSGTLSQRLTSLRGQQLMPAASPDRQWVAFISDAGGNPDLFLLKFDPECGACEKPRQLFGAPRSVQASPCFSPDSKRIAFVSDKSGTPRIYTLALGETQHPTLISSRCKGSTSPCWSPDGHFIAYSGMTDGTRQIWIYDCDKREEFQLTTGLGHKENPSWAPNSLHLVYHCAEKKACELYLIDLNRRRPTKISSGGGEKRFPVFEPR